MKTVRISPWGRHPLPSALFSATIALLLATTASANTQLLLRRGAPVSTADGLTGVVNLTIDPGFPAAKVTVEIDGQKVATGLGAPWHLPVDFGPVALQRRIAITATASNGRAVRWTETVNRGNLPLGVRLRAADLAARTFVAEVTAPNHDPVERVQLWHDGRVIASSTRAPHRFTVPEDVLASGFVQVTARTHSGEESADFWTAGGNVHTEEMLVRTIPIFVSVVDRDGQTRDDVDRSQFRVLDNEMEGKIVEFGKAFDQPISIALLLDASASMTHSMRHAAKAAADFVEKALREGDRCSVTAIQEGPRRRQALTGDRGAVARSLEGIQPSGRTALYDAVASAIRELRDEKTRRAIVVLSDGSDTSSITSWDEVHQMAREAAIPMYFIVYEGAPEAEAARQLDRLRFLAAETGGFVAAATQQNLLAKYQAIERDLRAQFAITYQITDMGKPNEYRRVRVVLDSPKLTARTIRGYFAP